MTLLRRDTDILGFVELKPSLSSRHVASRLALRPSRVAWTLRNLENQGIILQRILVNPSALGLRVVSVFFNLHTASERARTAVIRYIVAQERVSWCGSFEGPWDFGVLLWAQAPEEIDEFRQRVADHFGDFFIEWASSSAQEITYYSHKYLHGCRSRLEVRQTKRIAMDGLDHRLLQQLSRDGARDLRLSARSLGESLAVIEQRLARLTRSGVLVGTYYDINAAKIGMPSVRILVALPETDEDTLKQILALAALHPNVIGAICGHGSWNLELIIESAKIGDVISLIRSLNERFAVSLSALTVVTLKQELKNSAYPLRHLVEEI